MFMNKSILIAIAVTVVLTLWVVSGLIFSGDNQPATAQAEKSEQAVFMVSARRVSAEPYRRDLVIHGRTDVLRSVQLRSEISGKVMETPAIEGTRVKAGEIICRLATDERKANLAQAKALGEQRRLEYDAALELTKKGHRSATQLAQAKAQYEAALAQIEQMQIALDNTMIKAPFDGLLNERPAHIGDYLQVGELCGTLLDDQPFLVVGEVSESDVGKLEKGSPAQVQIANDAKREGTIRYISANASERTRTYRVEVVIPNPALDLRAGMSATVHVPLEQSMAFKVSAASLVLNASGRLGLRAVDGNNIVRFYPVTIMSDVGEDLWVSGLPAALSSIDLITVGQQFVSEGQMVRTDTAKTPEIAG